MEHTCQRCSQSLRDDDRYCPSCGLPQLVHVPAEPALAGMDGEFESSSVAGRQAHHDNSRGLVGGAGQAIAWRPALRAAMLLAIPAGVLSSDLSVIGQSLGLVWMVSCAVWAVVLYGRHVRLSRITKGVGSRIGLMTGLFACWITLALNGVNLWAARFVFHQNGRLDSEWTAFVDQNIRLCQNLYTQMGISSAQIAQGLQMDRLMFLSPEGQAGFPLFHFAFNAVFFVLLSALGGAVGARFIAPSHRTRS